MEERILPMHFARGLQHESCGYPVNWAAFAMQRCFPAHRRRPFEPFPQFADLRGPLQWTHPKVMPLRRPEQGVQRNRGDIVRAVGGDDNAATLRHRRSAWQNPKREINSTHDQPDIAPPEAPRDIPEPRVYRCRGNHNADAGEIGEDACFCGGSPALLRGFLTLRPELESTATEKKQKLTELVQRDEFIRTRKRSAAALAEERTGVLREKHMECSRAHDCAVESHARAHSKMVAAATELNSVITNNVDPNVLVTLTQVQQLTTVLERGCLNNVRRYAERVEHYSDRVRDCEEEAMLNADDLQLFELDLSIVSVNRREQVQGVRAVSEFLASRVTEENRSETVLSY
ncbi:hypothetical protein M758_UG229000 [Ceratodon purpureus]|nr:hypothetical protein M758_UG229000 [Ceratodon purpureus]